MDSMISSFKSGIKEEENRRERSLVGRCAECCDEKKMEVLYADDEA